VGGFVGGATTAAAHGGKVNVIQVAADAFGNAVGSGLVAAESGGGQGGYGAGPALTPNPNTDPADFAAMDFVAPEAGVQSNGAAVASGGPSALQLAAMNLKGYGAGPRTDQSAAALILNAAGSNDPALWASGQFDMWRLVDDQPSVVGKYLPMAAPYARPDANSDLGFGNGVVFTASQPQAPAQTGDFAGMDEGAIYAQLGDANPMAYRLEEDSARGKLITGFASALWKGVTELPLEVTDVVTAGWNVATGDNQYVGYSMLGQKAMNGAGTGELTVDVLKNALSVLPPIGAMRSAYNLTEALQNDDPTAAGGALAGLATTFGAAKAMGYDRTAILSDGIPGGLGRSQRGAIADFSLAPMYENQLPSSLADELATARRLGVSPMSPADPAFDSVINEGPIKYAVTPNGDLLVIPKYAADGTEISHAVLTGGKPVISAGEADIVGNAQDGYIGTEIEPHSGHYMNGNTPAQNAAVVQLAKDAFLKYGIGF
jgi:hypothetical protein